LVSAADKASSAGFWAHFNIVTYLLTTYTASYCPHPAFLSGRLAAATLYSTGLR